MDRRIKSLSYRTAAYYFSLAGKFNTPQYNESLGKLFSLLILAGVLCAQDRPQFVWQGEVDGIDILYLHDNRLEVQIKDGAPVAKQQFLFHDKVPEMRQDARLEIREGRGYVHIVDQPRLDNHYTIGVLIEDRQPGSSFYSIAMYWDVSKRALEGTRQGRRDRVAWNGRVDEEAIISCQGKSCFSSALQGVPVAGENFKFSRPLPARDVEVTLEESQGRGEIRVVEQPRQRNHYTARVSIRDPQSGSGEYSFVLAWNRTGAVPPEPPNPQRGLTWSGVVEGRVRVTVQGGSALSETMEGKAISGEHAEFVRPLPSRSDLNPVVKKLSGRGRVELVEVPSERNHYRLVFEISSPESDSYEVEVDW